MKPVIQNAGQLLGVASLFLIAIGIGIAIKFGSAGFYALPTAKLLFPYAVLIGHFFDSFWSVPLLFMFFQFPIYSIVLVVANYRNPANRSLLTISVLHVVSVITCFVLDAIG